MTTPEHEKLEKIFNSALEIESPAELEAYLDLVCGDSPEFRKKITKLLKAHEDAGTFMETPAVEPEAVFEPEATGTRIGKYKILQVIGEGGFGTVYMAEQELPVSRMVALKIIKLGMDTKEVIARFEVEQQALALMDHPNIAKVLDAGATETGRPYFVMELVKGITITQYCDRNKLSTRERLELILQVCQAVQHAHQKGIIHRDLKPSNVLVALHANRPVPKVIDFGIAKATSRRLTEKTLFTEFRQFIGTPEYMSPDQAEVSGLDMDTRTDVYSLGVMMYELLTGTTPFDAKSLRETSYDEIRRIIREVEPPKPSTRLQTLSETPEGRTFADFRQAEPAALVRAVRGDLDWIAMKAMEKDRTRRYATAKDLADDIERYLLNKPVLACPPSMGYRFKKFVRRNRVGVVAGTVVGLAIIVGISLAIAGLVQATRATEEMKLQRNAAVDARRTAQENLELAEKNETEALAMAAKSAAASAFLEGMLRSVDPSQALGREVTVRYVLDEAVKKIDEGALTDYPEIEGRVRMTLGETYLALGLYTAAEEHLRYAVMMLSSELGKEDPVTLHANRALAVALRTKGRFTEAESLLRETADAQRRVLGEEHPDTLETRNELALSLWGPGRYEEAETIHREILEIQRRVLGESDADTVMSMNYLGVECRELRKTGEAGFLLGEALKQCRATMGDDHPCTAEIMNNLGRLREENGELEQAEILYRRTYEGYQRILGPDHPRTLLPLNNLLRVLHRQRKAEAIQPLAADRIAHMRRQTYRADATANTFHTYAWELLNCESAELRDPASALPAAKRAVELDNGANPTTLETLALAYRMTGDLEMAIETQRQALAATQGGGLYDRAKIESRLRDYLMESGDLAGALPFTLGELASGLSDLVIPDGLLQPTTLPDSALINQSEALMEEGRYMEAADVLRSCLAMRRKTLPDGHWLVEDTRSRLGGALAGAGKYAEAEPLLLQAYAALKDDPQVTADYRQRAVALIISLYEAWGKTGKAAEWRGLEN